MSYVNTLSKKEAEFLFEAVKSYQTELQASMDFKVECLHALGTTCEREVKQQYVTEIAQHKQDFDKCFAMKLKLQKILA